MSISSVALRNLNRNRLKTLLSMIAIVIGVAFFIQSMCANNGRRVSGFLNLINYEAGAVQIYKKGYYSIKDEQPLYESIIDPSKIEAVLDRDYFTAPRVRFNGSILSPQKEMDFSIIAVDPERESNIFLYPRDIAPRNITKGAFEMVMGYRAAKQLGVVVGDPVRLMAQIEFREGGRIKTITQLLDFTLVGLITSDNLTVSTNTAFIPMDILQDENGMMLNGSVTEIVIRDRDFHFEDMPTPRETVQTISHLLPDDIENNLTVKSWTDYDVDQIKQLSTNEMAPIFVFMTLLIIMLMSNTMLLSVMDRTREISLLKAMGMDSVEIFKLLALEAGYLGLFGAIIGLIMGYLITVDAVNTGYKMTVEFIEANSMKYTMTGTIKSAWSLEVFVIAGITAIVTSVLAAVVPTLSALKMNIIKGIRHE